MITRFTPEQLQALEQEQNAAAGLGGPVAAEQIPEVKNIRAVEMLGQDRLFTFRPRSRYARAFRVPPVPYPAGQRLQMARLKIAVYAAQTREAEKRAVEMSKEGDTPEMRAEWDSLLADYEERLRVFHAVLADTVALFWTLVQPWDFWDRIFWRGRHWWLPDRWALSNPFGNCSEGEISDLIDFFWKCRMTSPVRHSRTN